MHESTWITRARKTGLLSGKQGWQSEAGEELAGLGLAWEERQLHPHSGTVGADMAPWQRTALSSAAKTLLMLPRIIHTACPDQCLKASCNLKKIHIKTQYLIYKRLSRSTW